MGGDGDGKENIHFLLVLMMGNMVMEVLLMFLFGSKGSRLLWSRQAGVAFTIISMMSRMTNVDCRWWKEG